DERRNRTLIEAARTMLADSKLPTTFWAEAVNVACYVQNRVLVVKPHNKTSYELFHGRTPTLSFMRPFRCLVTILNTIDHLGKFDGKADEGFFVGYSLNSKAFRVFNSRTRIVKENLHIRFSESTPNVAGVDLFGYLIIDALPRNCFMSSIIASTQSNGFAVQKASDNVGDLLSATKKQEILSKKFDDNGCYVGDIIFGSTKKELCNAFEKLKHEKFQMSSMGELTFFLGLQVQQKKDGIFISQDKYDKDGEEVDVHMYRLMIGSLMYLTSSRPDIMFAYPKDSPFDLVAYTDSDYARQAWIGSLQQEKLSMRLLQVAIDKCFGFRINNLIIEKAKKSVRLLMEKLVIRENRQRVLVRKIIERICENKNRKRAVRNKNRQSDLVSKRIERSGELKIRKRVENIKNRQSVWNGIGVNAGDSKLMLLGINLILLVKVNAARHKLTTAVES
ncbi:ribonuclease H-like domain-containing protein, partial [Tanacetum coccineum]